VVSGPMQKVTASPELAARVREMLVADGVLPTSRRLGFPRETLLRLAFQLPVRRGTTALLERALDPAAIAAPPTITL